MIIRSKNGVKLELKPDHWWDPIDWWYVIYWAWMIKHNKVILDPEAWKGSYRGGGIK